MEKVSHKFIKETAGISLNCNIYTGENVVYYLQKKDFENVKKELNNESNEKQLEQLKNIIEGAILRNATISLEKIAYSCGYYGNTGQLFNVYYLFDTDEEKTLLTTFGF